MSYLLTIFLYFVFYTYYPSYYCHFFFKPKGCYHPGPLPSPLPSLTSPCPSAFFSLPQAVLSSWSEACYDEARALELEEALVRRVCAQGQMGTLPPVAIRRGTGYLTLRRQSGIVHYNPTLCRHS